MIRELAARLPHRSFHLCADGAYACLAGAGLPRTHVTSRMRRDAALYEAAPPPTGRRGRPRTKGARLPTPPELAAQARRRDWQRVSTDVRGQAVERLVYVGDVLWYAVNKRDLVRLVVVRDPAGIEPDDFFFTTDLGATGAEVPPATPGAGPSSAPSATPSRTSAARTPNAGSARVPNAPPPCRCGCTASSGAGTSTPTQPEAPGPHGPGTPASPHRASLTRLPRSAAPCGPDELQGCHL